MSIFDDFDVNYGEGYYTGLSSVDEGTDIFHNNLLTEHVQNMNDFSTNFKNGAFEINSPNVDGGTDTFIDGKEVQHTQDNIFGGKNIYGEDHELQQVTIPNASGGVDVFNGDMELKGTSFANIYGNEDYLSFDGNFEEIMQYSDPLEHVSEYKMLPFDANKIY